jgi:ribosomal protein S18 acetylase RimI-like enzyme
MEIIYRFDTAGVDWHALKQALAADDFDNGRTVEQYQRSFDNSDLVCIAYAGDQIVGNARVLSDGVCNAYLVDVWTHSAFRRRGIARHMVEAMLARLPGQHVYLQSDDDTVEFYKSLGFRERPTGLERVVGRWLVNEPE